MEQEQKKENLLSKIPTGDSETIVTREDINSNSIDTITEESIVTPQQSNSSSSNNNNNRTSTTTLPGSSKSFSKKEQKEISGKPVSFSFTHPCDNSTSSLKTNYQTDDDDEPPQSSNSGKVVSPESRNRISDLSVRVQGVLRRILGQNYSDMDPNFHSSVVNSPLSATSSPSSSSSLPCSPQISQKRLPKSDSFCDCYVLGKEKSCQCGEEDSCK